MERSIQPELFCKNKSFIELTEKHLCQSHFLNKVADLRPATLLKETLAEVLSCKVCEIFKKTFFIEHTRWLLLDEDDTTPYSVNATKDLVINELVEFFAVLFKCYDGNYVEKMAKMF